ncbi:MAG: hypothetical protein OXB88_00020 [Bacteriovoracales bacterium]|nr:hypothetical protein [Bacteriovoracales bacterium]
MEDEKQRQKIDAKNVTARTSSKNCNKGNVTAIHLDEIGGRQRRTTAAYFKYAAGSDEADDCQDRQMGEQLPKNAYLLQITS